jgi:hypothetical protein
MTAFSKIILPYLSISIIYLSIYLSMALEPFVGPRPLFQFLNIFTQSVGPLDGGSACRKAIRNQDPSV